MKLSTDRNDLQRVRIILYLLRLTCMIHIFIYSLKALQETQLLRVTSMSTALLTVYIDSAKNLPQVRAQSKPDPYLILTVGKKKEQTAVQMRTDSPVWEQGFTFLVGNPDNDSLQLKIIDQKTEKELGHLTYILRQLLEKNNMETVSQPFQLQKSGPESKLNMHVSLKILKKSIPAGDDVSISSTSERDNTNSSAGLPRSNSVKLPPSPTDTTTSQLSKQDSSKSFAGYDTGNSQEEVVYMQSAPTQMASPPRTPDSNSGMELHHRVPSEVHTAGVAGLGRIQLTVRYSVQRQRLIVIVHKIMYAIILSQSQNFIQKY